MWAGLSLGLIKIKQNNVVWAWTLLKLSKIMLTGLDLIKIKQKKKGDIMDFMGFKPMTII